MAGSQFSAEAAACSRAVTAHSAAYTHLLLAASHYGAAIAVTMARDSPGRYPGIVLTDPVGDTGENNSAIKKIFAAQVLDLTRALVTEPHIITRTFYASPDPFSQDKVGLDIYNIYISTYLQYQWPGGGGVGGLAPGQLPPAEDQRPADILHPAHRSPGEH